MSEEHQPPEEIWLDDEALADHFDNVKRNLSRSSSGDDWEPIGDAGTQNELTRDLRKG